MLRRKLLDRAARQREFVHMLRKEGLLVSNLNAARTMLETVGLVSGFSRRKVANAFPYKDRRTSCEGITAQSPVSYVAVNPIVLPTRLSTQGVGAEKSRHETEDKPDSTGRSAAPFETMSNQNDGETRLGPESDKSINVAKIDLADPNETAEGSTSVVEVMPTMAASAATDNRDSLSLSTGPYGSISLNDAETLSRTGQSRDSKVSAPGHHTGASTSAIAKSPAPAGATGELRPASVMEVANDDRGTSANLHEDERDRSRDEEATSQAVPGRSIQPDRAESVKQSEVVGILRDEDVPALHPRSDKAHPPVVFDYTSAKYAEPSSGRNPSQTVSGPSAAPSDPAAHPVMRAQASPEVDLTDGDGPTSRGALFQKSRADRSPQAWLARLKRTLESSQSLTTQDDMQEKLAPGELSVRVEDGSTQPRSRLSQSARRFLQPLAGVDPATVRIQQGPASSRLAAGHRADALAIGNTILLARGLNERPDTLALLAHELIHVRRRSEPRFVPSVIRNQSQERGPSPRSEEESVAQQIEGVTRHLARIRQGADFEPFPHQSSSALDDGTQPNAPQAHNAEEPEAMIDRPTVAAPPPWGTLPAPWESIPWPAQSTDGASSRGRSLVDVKSVSTDDLAVRAARVDRSISQQATLMRQSEDHHTDATEAGADLDSFAMQVYQILKRRLATERRREG